jgi:hypothetical protein
VPDAVASITNDVARWIESLDVVAGLGVFDIERAPDEGLVQEPNTPGECASRLRADPGFEFLRIERFEGGD